MAQKLTSSSYGKAFLWLVAIAIALLVEGYLSQQFGGASEALATPEPSEVSASPTIQVEHFAAGLARAAQVFRTLR